MIQTIYDTFENIRTAIGCSLLFCIITPLYIVKYIEDLLNGVPEPVEHINIISGR